MTLNIEPARRWAAQRRDRLDALILFGSHAKGTATGDSDIDFYAVGEVSRDDVAALKGAYPGIPMDVARHTLAEFQEALNGGELRFEHEVYRTGCVVAGDLEACEGPAAPKLLVNRRSVASHLVAACNELQVQASQLVLLTRRPLAHGQPTQAKLVAASADAAERAAKAVVALTGLVPVKSHYVPDLARQLRFATRFPSGPDTQTVADLPSNRELAERIMRMDRQTESERLRVEVYEEGGVFADEPAGRELIAKAHARFFAVLRCVLWLHGLFERDPAFEEVASKVRAELAGVVQALCGNHDAGLSVDDASALAKAKVRAYEVKFKFGPQVLSSLSSLVEASRNGHPPAPEQ